MDTKAFRFIEPTHHHHSTNCAFADKQYCRPLFSPDPEVEEKLQVQKIIHGTGKHTCTPTLSNRRQPAFTPIMLRNDIPEFSKIDKAVNQRVKIAPFKRKFVHPPPRENYNLVEDLATLEVKQAFIWILISTTTKRCCFFLEL